jgi:concentrative nucleoside transporter, CNT family
VQTLFAWFFILVIIFRFVPNSVVTRPVEAVWEPLVSRPFFTLPRAVRYAMGAIALLAVVLGSAFGTKLQNGSTFADRGISVVGLLIFQSAFFLTSKNRKSINW